MNPILIFVYFIIITIIFFIFLLRNTDFKMKFSEYLMKKIDNLQNEIDDIDKKMKDMDEKTQAEEYLKLKLKMRTIVRKGLVAEVRIVFSDKDIAYKIYGFSHYVVFARENDEVLFEKSEFMYKTLDELYEADNMDSICLQRDWKKIKECKIRAMKIVKIDS